jgi:ATP-dependent helicase/nuclease subunit A
MTARQWNEGQRNALEAKGCNILVSAAAGSGKTSVLTERVIRHIVGEGCDIREMLIVTFSSAAAAEMKERIYGALQDAAAENGARLSRQAELLAEADICTIHSFCSRVIRENFEQAGVSPNVYTLSAGESDILKEEAMEELFDELYESGDEGFLRLISRYSGRSDLPLRAFLFKLHNFFTSLADYEAWLTEKLACQEDGAFIGELAEEFDTENLFLLEEAARLFTCNADICRARGFDAMAGAEEQNALYVRELKDIYEGAGRSAFAEAYGGSGSFEKAACKGMEKDFSDYLKLVREDAKGIIKKIAENEYIMDFEERVASEIAYTMPDLDEILGLYRLFHARYAEAKREKNALDFNDLEHKALLALSDPQVGARYKERYRYVFVDEYQDTNPVQEEIISRISREDNRFMVGDLKQSIYRFRQADPMIFKDKALRYCKEAAEGRLIRMNGNFRSFGEVIGFINYCMGNLMSERLGDIEYCGGEELAAGRPLKGGTVSLILCPAKDREAEDNCDEEPEEEELTQAEREAHCIALRIKKLMDGSVADERSEGQRPAAYGDIAILLREVKSTGKVMKMVLQSYGIPAYVEADAVLSDYPEVESFIDLLRVVDHFAQDIPLLSVMRSGYGGFDAAEMADIRIRYNDAKQPYYEALQRYALEQEGPLAEKAARFLKRIRRLKLMSQGMRIEEFLLVAEKETGFGEKLTALKGGEHKYASLSGILENAGAAGKSATESLSAFIQYIEDMLRTGRLSDMIKPQGGKNTVKILSIHKSKGLEFPIVFLPRLNKHMNMREAAENMLICRETGIAIKYTDEKKLIKRDPYLKRLAAERIRKASLSEELRVLYVALTRAKQHLILCGSVGKLKQNALKWQKPRFPYALSKCNSYLDWLMPLLLRMEGAEEILGLSDLGGLFFGETVPLRLQAEVVTSIPSRVSAGEERKARLLQYLRDLPEDTLDALSFTYPYKADLPVPSKRSVTDIKKGEAGEGPAAVTRPAVEEEEGGFFSAAEKGTITHYAMRYLDLFSGLDATAQLKGMNGRAFLSAEETAAVDTGWVETFLKSDIAKRVRDAEAFYREMPFCLDMDAGELGYARSGGKVIVQGVIDLCFLEGGQWVIVDYKTDRVDRGTAPDAALGYKKQLDLYEKALFEITRIPVKERYIYFFREGLYPV